MRVLLVLALVLPLVMLGACGKKGSPRAPGPDSEVTFPRSYPSR